MSDLVLYEQQEEISIIKLNRPQARNALSTKLLKQLDLICEQVQKSSFRVLIITGTGEKAFCAGADLKERLDMNEEETLEFVKLIQNTIHKISLIEIPTICALNGHAFGGGLELALACDIRVIDEKSYVGLTECSLGIIPGAGGTQRLTQIVGMAKALELILRAKKIDSHDAEAMGLVNYVAESGEALDAALSVARAIAQNAPLALIAAKKAVKYNFEQDLRAGLRRELELYKTILSTKDRREGLQAFKEKRTPKFVGV